MLADLLVSDLIDRFWAENQEDAMVVDPDDGSVVGLVTAPDAFGAITGNLEDPLDWPDRYRLDPSRRVGSKSVNI
ncbi:inosine monophosphate dehydrogenase [Halococcus saccharolyticus DSM 5350]|uniref:Inosine monophosphate dehydrogenase n=1 Tax=Halococcus saccharolyticus DSM 5350 TaxID=1227455 RepID=M0MI60_9EURY|nr:inosine monophosphate dehydrogenase [Halococcus saccharolyticus DSM 5350]